MAWSQAVGLCVRTKPLRSALKSRLPSLPSLVWPLRSLSPGPEEAQQPGHRKAQDDLPAPTLGRRGQGLSQERLQKGVCRWNPEGRSAVSFFRNERGCVLS